MSSFLGTTLVAGDRLNRLHFEHFARTIATMMGMSLFWECHTNERLALRVSNRDPEKYLATLPGFWFLGNTTIPLCIEYRELPIDILRERHSYRFE